MSIWVCGEVLIDLLPGTPDRVAVVGGGPANTAKALARLGHDVHFIDGISTDAGGNVNGCSCVVNSGVNVTVNSGHTLSIMNAVTNSGGVFTFENNASLVQGPNVTVNTNSGNITYKRNTAPMRLYDYTYWSSPVSGFTLYSLSPDTVSNEYFSYNPTLGWSSISNGTATMTPGVGYILSAPRTFSNSYSTVYNANFIGTYVKRVGLIA